MMRAWLVLVLAIAACGSSLTAEQCTIRCSVSGGCPNGMACAVDGFCHEDGDESSCEPEIPPPPPVPDAAAPIDAAAPADAEALAGCQTFATPGNFDFVVPGGTSLLEIRAWGAGGGSGDGGYWGGAGGYATSVVTVGPGEELTVVVGAPGSPGVGGTGGAGGAPGGAPSPNAPNRAGGGGGGFSAVIRGSTEIRQDNLILLAGGGGGAGGGSATVCEGGGGGGETGERSTYATGGSQLEGGCGVTSLSCGRLFAGGPGSLVRAAGGEGIDGGGGGGGGYFGGGGGSGGGSDGSGGGGGSGFVTGTDAQLVPAVRVTPGGSTVLDRGTAGEPQSPGRVVVCPGS